MRCVSPLLVDPRGRADIVPCGKCGVCLHNRRVDWSFRLANELRGSLSAFFVTLTYSDENLPSDLSVHKEHVQTFMKNLRYHHPGKLRFYAVGEYGTKTHRPHYHLILYNVRYDFDYVKAWPFGQVHVGSVTPASIHYVTKYHVNKTDYPDGRGPPFTLMSRRPGIGARYIQTHRKYHQDGKKPFAQNGGVITRLPRYYKEKIFNVHQRQMLTIEANQLAEEKYMQELQELLHQGYSNPALEYENRQYYWASNYKQKSNQLNKF